MSYAMSFLQHAAKERSQPKKIDDRPQTRTGWLPNFQVTSLCVEKNSGGCPQHNIGALGNRLADSRCSRGKDGGPTCEYQDFVIGFTSDEAAAPLARRPKSRTKVAAPSRRLALVQADP
jgi:hypothetical protein